MYKNSDLKYFHYTEDSTYKYTVLAKEFFNYYVVAPDVNVEHYYYDNGIFTDNNFTKHYKDIGQLITHCGVNDNFKDGRAEKMIRDIQTAARTMLLHAKSKWPAKIHLSLWPYAMQMAVHVHKNSPKRNHRSSRIEAFSQVAVYPKSGHYHTFGCPVYHLMMQAVTGKSEKWENQANLRIYLGPPPFNK